MKTDYTILYLTMKMDMVQTPIAVLVKDMSSQNMAKIKAWYKTRLDTIYLSVVVLTR
mgnify:CR=1 FL=1